MTRNFTGKFFLCQGLTVSVFPYRITLLGSKQTMSISENNQKSSNVPPCKYEDVVLYYQEKANIYCEPFQEIFMGKNFYDEEDI